MINADETGWNEDARETVPVTGGRGMRLNWLFGWRMWHAAASENSPVNWVQLKPRLGDR